MVPPNLVRGIVSASGDQRGVGLSQAPPADVAEFATASNALYKLAIEPAAGVIGDTRLLIVADGALNYVPFEAFVKTKTGADYASLDYLVKSNEIAYAPSASVIAAIRNTSSAPGAGGNTILIVADPIFNADDPRLKGARVAAGSSDARGIGLALNSAVSDVTGTQVTDGLRLARLPGTRTEAEAIGAIARAGGAKSESWIDLAANEEKIDSADVANYRIVHIATHGLLHVERPQFTGVVLSLVGSTKADGFLRTDEIFNLKMRPSLVMLSACETGLGKEKRGEGVIGLTRAFMYAGAPTVGVSLWSVADKSTAELMTDFYKRLLSPSSHSSVAAMRDAQLAMISGKKYSAPFYWAPFVLVGEWK
jgi:CHAT domain-containing protein